MFWFAFFMSGPAQLHLCPLHDGHAQHSGHGAMPGHDLPGHNLPDHAGHHCTCAGTCCSANNVVVPAIAQSVESVIEIGDPSFSPDRQALVVTASKHLHPPSIGPPALHFV
jgi:hypothetical protein